MMRTRRLIVGCVVAGLASICLAGCGSSAAAGKADPPRLYPFDGAVYYTAADEKVIDRKLEQATSACMSRRGFDYPPSKPAAPVSTADRQPDNPYYLLDGASARTVAYDIVPAEVRRRQHARATPVTLDAKYTDALAGDQRHQHAINLPDGTQVTIAINGCTAVARKSVFGDGWDPLFYTVQALSNIVITRTSADGDVVGAWRAWARCVQRAGLRAKSPEELRQGIQHRARAATDGATMRGVAKAELTTAEEDAACQEQVGVRETVRAAQGRIEKDVLTTRFRSDLDQLRSRLRQVLGSTG